MISKYTFTPRWILLASLFLLGLEKNMAQIPRPALIGYFHNWNISSAPYIQLDQVDDRYNVIEVAFAVPKSGTDYQMEFRPTQLAPSLFRSQIQTQQSKGKKVLISMGGGGTKVTLDNPVERDSFVSSMTAIVEYYGFDGIDLDFEGSSLSLTNGDIRNPASQPIILMIDAIREIMERYRLRHGKKLLLTMAPETAHVQGGQSQYSGVWGVYLPIIHALRDSIDILQVQLYNSGTMYGIDRGIYSQGTADFIVAMAEAVIQGFNTQGGRFDGLPAHKVAVGLPACTSAAGGGYTSPADVQAALEYLLGKGPRPGQYTLYNPNGYPDLAGMMTWSINWDATTSCNTSFEYANTFETVFSGLSGLTGTDWENMTVYPNPAQDIVKLALGSANYQADIQLIDMNGRVVLNRSSDFKAEVSMDVSRFSAGIYTLQLVIEGQRHFFKLMKR